MKKILPPITKTQKQILLFLYKFRFTTTAQLQKYLNHKNHHRINEWINDLKEKGYISVIADSKNITVPRIYCLSTGSRGILKEAGADDNFLNKLYKERRLTNAFKNHCLFLVEVCLFFIANKDKNSKLAFCTKQDLTGFDYLPEDLDSYIAVETNRQTKRYFLELFDDYKKSDGVARFAVRKYLEYFENQSWQIKTNNAPFPSILFIFSNERKKKHIFYYAQAKLEKSFEPIPLFLTTQDMIRFNKSCQNIWQKVE